MNRKGFTFTLLVYGSLPPLITTLFFVIVKGVHEGNILSYFLILFLPGCISLYISSHILFKIIINRYRNNKSNWLSALYLILTAYILFGFISALAIGLYDPYKVFQDLQNYLIMSATMGGMGFVVTCWLSVPVGFYAISKYLKSTADASPIIN